MTCFISNTVAALCLLVCLYNCCVEAQRRFCGTDLADTLDIVCSGRGFHIRSRKSLMAAYESPFLTRFQRSLPLEDDNGNRPQAATKLNDTFSAQAPINKMSSLLGAVLDRRSRSFRSSSGGGSSSSSSRNNDIWQKQDKFQLWRRSGTGARGVVEECCLQPCQLETLESYCNADNTKGRIGLSQAQLQRILGLTSPPSSTTERPTSTTAHQRQTTNARPAAQINRGGNADRNSNFFYVSLGNQATRSPLVD